MHVDIEAVSGICGSMSIACWVVVFSPQIIENFRRSSAEGLSIVFIFVWLLGDLANIIGAVLQDVLPTMIILAVYYTLADIVLMLQCFYYRGFTLSDADQSTVSVPNGPQSEPNERSALLPNPNVDEDESPPSPALSRTSSPTSNRHMSLRESWSSLDAAQLSAAKPLHGSARDVAALKAKSPVQSGNPLLKAALVNLTAVLVVLVAGVLGWWFSASAPHKHKSAPKQRSELHFNVVGQIFGYICAVLYLGSRLPQLLLNYRRKSTEGISMLFFIFACLGNLTYVLSILAYEPTCRHFHRDGSLKDTVCSPEEAANLYGRNVLVNLSWLLGSLGTLFEDAAVFVQYFMYKKKSPHVSGPAEADNNRGE